MGRETKGNVYFYERAILLLPSETCDGREQLRQWLETRTKLVLTVTFFLSPQRAAKSDMDSLLGDLFNPLVEGACGPRPAGKPIPQTKDALFWEVHASKISDSNERTEVTIRRIDAPPDSPDAAALD